MKESYNAGLSAIQSGFQEQFMRAQVFESWTANGAFDLRRPELVGFGRPVPRIVARRPTSEIDASGHWPFDLEPRAVPAASRIRIGGLFPDEDVPQLLAAGVTAIIDQDAPMETGSDTNGRFRYLIEQGQTGRFWCKFRATPDSVGLACRSESDSG